MRVTVRLFAMLRQQAGWRERELELAEEASVADAWQALVGLEPGFESAGGRVRFARNGSYAEAGEVLRDGDQLAIIPPVAGGAGEQSHRRLELTDEPIADELLAELRRTLPDAADGALVLFVGQTRESAGTPAPGQEREAQRHAGKHVEALEYEAFEEMALATLEAIATEIEARFGVRRLAIVHRTGRVPLSQPSVVIAAAAPHRGAAFDACRYAIEELKARAPIWKAEHYEDGSVWVGAPARVSSSDDD
ncbi:MAG TPA: molybdenum cofactor biosynthesis protein MoaE [Candidatus Limnocylindria bacterium]|nr:molybdenum cofactor biosynthesis protein MoaE [Candidatus Limnocylindria bacterium]